MPCDQVAVMQAVLVPNMGKEILTAKSGVDALATLVGAALNTQAIVQEYRTGEHARLLVGTGEQQVAVTISEGRVYGRGGAYTSVAQVNKVVQQVQTTATALAQRLLSSKVVEGLRKKYVVKSDQRVGPSMRMVKISI